MDYVSAANQYLGQFGWGAQGRMLGISRMFQETDVNLLKKGKYVVSFRPRGVLSGFLVVLPSLRMSVYIPPIAGKIPARIIRMRLSDTVLQHGAIFSCYWDSHDQSCETRPSQSAEDLRATRKSAQDLVLEDVLVWKGQSVWQTYSFEDRWNKIMQEFCEEWRPDDVLQGIKIRLSEYIPLEQLYTIAENDVVEFIPCGSNTKRLIWLPTQQVLNDDTKQLRARRESTIGPDIFSLWTPANERLGIAYIKSLDVSRKLRLHRENEFNVKTVWNRRFERHEIVEIA